MYRINNCYPKLVIVFVQFDIIKIIIFQIPYNGKWSMEKQRSNAIYVRICAHENDTVENLLTLYAYVSKLEIRNKNTTLILIEIYKHIRMELRK
jgi:hypothetical protein